MEIASNVATAATEIILRPGEDLPIPAAGSEGINDPAPKFMRTYANEVFSQMGALAVSYSSSDRDQIKLRFQNFDLAKLADGVFKDTVLGAKLVYADANGDQFDMSKNAADWVYYPTNFARAASLLPGASSYKWNGPNVIITTDSTETRVKLQQLVERKLNGTLTAYWKGECFGPGCKPDPKPPTGELPE